MKSSLSRPALQSLTTRAILEPAAVLRARSAPTVRTRAPQSANPDRRLLPACALRASIAREAALAARSGEHHSVIVVRVGRREPEVTPRVVQAVVRTTAPGDDIGWLDADHLALSLPMTDAAAAVLRIASLAPASPEDCTVFTQPPDGFDPDQLSGLGVTTQPLAALLQDPLPRWKRVLDVCGAAVLLLLTAPLSLAAAVLVRCSSRGPVILRQRRAGQHGLPFVCLKFRTMVDGADAMKAALLRFNERAGPAFKMKNDPRITRIGRLLRKTSIDELPQLWNVLRGDMSLVGPRPPTFDEVHKYQSWHHRRLSVTPGITCLWQVTSRGGVNFDDWVRMDLRYIEQRSLPCDLRLLAATVPAVLSRRGAS